MEIVVSSFAQWMIFIVMFVVKKQGSLIKFFLISIVTNNKPILLTIKGKCLEVIVNMIKFEILNWALPTKVWLLISIHVYGKLQLLLTYALVDFQVDTQEFIQEI